MDVDVGSDRPPFRCVRRVHGVFTVCLSVRPSGMYWMYCPVLYSMRIPYPVIVCAWPSACSVCRRCVSR